MNTFADLKNRLGICLMFYTSKISILLKTRRSQPYWQKIGNGEGFTDLLNKFSLFVLNCKLTPIILWKPTASLAWIHWITRKKTYFFGLILEKFSQKYFTWMPFVAFAANSMSASQLIMPIGPLLRFNHSHVFLHSKDKNILQVGRSVVKKIRFAFSHQTRFKASTLCK